MDTVVGLDRSVLLHNISWKSYLQMSDSVQGESKVHFTYDQGRLEIMVVSIKHELLKKLLAILLERLAENLDIDFLAAGSTTFRREDLERAFEPDECYYIENAFGMRGKETLNMDFDPPPDLSIEVDIAHSSLDRMSIFAAVGIPEVWRYDGERLEINILGDGSYHISENSSAFPRVSASALSVIIKDGQRLTQKEFLARIRAYTDSIK